MMYHPSHHMRAPVKIKNPAGGVGCVNRKRAKSLVRRGRARWLDEHTIEFIATNHQAARIHAARLQQIDYDRASRTGFATEREIRNLPMVGPIERILTDRRRAA